MCQMYGLGFNNKMTEITDEPSNGNKVTPYGHCTTKSVNCVRYTEQICAGVKREIHVNYPNLRINLILIEICFPTPKLTKQLASQGSIINKLPTGNTFSSTIIIQSIVLCLLCIGD